VQDYGIRVMPINFYHGGKIYKDGVDITPSGAYKLFLESPDSFKTSAISPEECLETYRRASKQCRDILCITVSAKLSGVYNVARNAQEQAEAELLGTTIEVVDSGTVAAAQGLVVLAAARVAASGKNLNEVLRVVEEVKSNVNLVALMDTVRYVYRSGRIPKVAARIGSLLNIRPIFTVSSGVVHFKGAVRNKDNGVKKILRAMKELVGTERVHVVVMHAYAQDEAERLKERVSSEFDCAELWLSEFSPVMGYTCGTGTIGLAFYTDNIDTAMVDKASEPGG